MVKRSSPSLVLERSPLVYFVAQVRFAAILQMSDKVPAVQEALRRTAFPVFKHAVVQAFKFDAQGAFNVELRPLWHFENIDSTAGIVLSNDFASYQATKYDRFETTLPQFIDALRVIDEAVDIRVLQRCGIRYVDVVHPEGDQTFETYLGREVMGLSGKIEDVVPVNQSSVFTGTSECGGTLVVKFVTNEAPNVLPPDLMPITLDVRLPINSGDRIGTLDFDHFLERQEAFSVERAEEILDGLHDASSRAFKACVTSEALRLWGQRDA